MIPRPRFPGASAHSDQRLLELARKGDERAFELIVRRHRSALLSYCRRLGLGDARAEDAVQQTFISAWLALCRGDEVRDLSAWLGRITHNKAISLLRAGAPAAGAELPLETVWDGRAGIDERLALRHTLAAVAALPERQRDALLLSAIDGRSYEEVAAALGITPGAVRGLLHRARENLRAGAGAVAPLPLGRAAHGWLRRAGLPAGRAAELTAPGGGAGGALRAAAAAVTTAALATGVAVGPLHSLISGHGGHRATAASAAQQAGGPTTRESAGAGGAAPTRTLAEAPAGGPAGAQGVKGATVQGTSTQAAGGGSVPEGGRGVERGAGSPRTGGGSGGAGTQPEESPGPTTGNPATAAVAPASGQASTEVPTTSAPAPEPPATGQPESPRTEPREHLVEHEEEPPERELESIEPSPPPPSGTEPETPVRKDH
jgi:RNA polymerase sigma-70 factor (ECF subfamily)